jgi:hypothetical protein
LLRDSVRGQQRNAGTNQREVFHRTANMLWFHGSRGRISFARDGIESPDRRSALGDDRAIAGAAV